MSFLRFLFWLIVAAAVSWAILYLVRFHSPKVFFPVQGEFLSIGKDKLYLLQKGADGEPLLLLAGLPGHSDAYQAWFKTAWPGFRLIAVDLPGTGLSDKQVGVAATPEDLALVIKLFLDRMGIKRLSVVGQDLGGGVAMVLAANYPNLVQRLILLAPDSSMGQAGQERGWWTRPAWIVSGWGTLFLGRDLIREWLRDGWAPGSEQWIAYVENYYRPLDSAGGRRGFLSLQRGRYGFDYRSFEEHLQVPTLILWGEQDPFIPVDQAGRLAERLGQARVQRLSGVGHFLLEEASDEVIRSVRDFLASAPEIPTSDGGTVRANPD